MIVEFLIGVLVLGGIITVAISFVMIKKLEDENEYRETKLLDKITAVGEEEADKLYSIYDEISKSGENVLKDIDVKYNDILVLYDMISKKEQNLQKDIPKNKFSNEHNRNEYNRDDDLIAISNLYDSVVVEKSEDLNNKSNTSKITPKDDDMASHLRKLFEQETDGVVFEKKESERVKLEDKLLETLKESVAKHEIDNENTIKPLNSKKVINNKERNNKSNKNFNFKGNKKAEDILRLKSEGLDSTEIAKTLNIGKGEVELILGLGGN